MSAFATADGLLQHKQEGNEISFLLVVCRSPRAGLVKLRHFLPMWPEFERGRRDQNTCLIRSAWISLGSKIICCDGS